VGSSSTTNACSNIDEHLGHVYFILLNTMAAIMAHTAVIIQPSGVTPPSQHIPQATDTNVTIDG
jgi:hypothetical protein